MSSYQQCLAQSHVDAVDESQRLLDQTLLDCPMFDNVAPRTIVNWVVTMFQFLLAFLDAVFREITAHISDVKEDALTSGGASLNVAVAARSRPTPRATTWPAKSPQCAKCHTHHHSTEECMMKDPAAMRKRVARNQRKKKNTRKPPPIPVSHPLYPFIAATVTPSPTPKTSPWWQMPRSYGGDAASQPAIGRSIVPPQLPQAAELCSLLGECWK
ncbi:hypothetical protein EDC04DRAFT_2613184 [Pisolithus marmoratus]|nr:hypothetical protein EDC04DRAFT_2613184 [Pisolithus marmoratus]